MKVKQFLDHYNMGSNAKVILCHTITNKETRLTYDKLREQDYTIYEDNNRIDISEYKLYSFTVRDNELIIYT